MDNNNKQQKEMAGGLMMPQNCVECGKPYLKNVLGLYLPTCDCGFVKEQDIEVSKQSDEKLYIKTLKSSKIPKKYYNRTFSNIDQFNNDFINAAKNWVDIGLGQGKSFYVEAPKSTGKSMISSIMGHECIKKGKSVYYTKPIRIYGDIFNTQVDTGIKIDFLKTVDVLIIDDLVKGVVNDWHKYVLFDIIDERYENEMVNIFNAWEKEGKVEEKIGEDLVDRIKEMCGDHYHKFDNLKNYRI